MNPHTLAVAALGVTGIYAIWSDVRSRRLPNGLCIIVAVLGVAVTLYANGPGVAGSGLLHGLAALLVGMLLFSAGTIGGGDAKYYAAVAVWYSISQAGQLLLSVSAAGFVLFIAWFVWRRLRGIKVAKASFPNADKFPYGVAIAVGAFALLVAPSISW